MENHRPHAAKTWPEVFIEIGRIVAPIRIALALEQGLDALHEQRIQNAAQEFGTTPAETPSRLDQERFAGTFEVAATGGKPANSLCQSIGPTRN